MIVCTYTKFGTLLLQGDDDFSAIRGEGSNEPVMHFKTSTLLEYGASIVFPATDSSSHDEDGEDDGLETLPLIVLPFVVTSDIIDPYL